MEIKHCPSCGSGDIDKNSYSAEYMSSTSYSCEDCNWSYKKGSGVGTGSGCSGTHPRKAGNTGKNATLVQTGIWCSTCNTCAKPGYCRCVEDGQDGFCETCAEYSKHDVSEMHEVATYFGRYSYHDGFTCSVCGEEKSEYKIV